MNAIIADLVVFVVPASPVERSLQGVSVLVADRRRVGGAGTVVAAAR